MHAPRDKENIFTSLTSSDAVNLHVSTHSFYNSNKDTLFVLSNATPTGVSIRTPFFKVIPNEHYTFQYYGFMNTDTKSIDSFVMFKNLPTIKMGDDYDSYIQLEKEKKLSPSQGSVQSSSFDVPANANYAYIRLDNNGTLISGNNADFWFIDLKLNRGTSLDAYCPAPADNSSATKYVVKKIIDVDQDSHIFDYTPSSEANGAFLVASNRTFEVDQVLTPEDMESLLTLNGVTENTAITSLNRLTENNAIDLVFGVTSRVHNLLVDANTQSFGDWIITTGNNIVGSNI